MILFLLFLISTLCFLTKYFSGNKLIFHLALIYIFWYGFNLIVSCWNPYELNSVGTTSYFLQSIGFTSLILGYLTHPSIKENTQINSKLNTEFQKSIFFKLNVLIALIIILIVLQKFFLISSLLPKEARDIYFEELSNNVSIPLFKFLWSWYIPVVVIYVQILLSVILVSSYRPNKLWIAIYLITVMSYLSIGFGRAQIQQFLYITILIFIINSNGYLKVIIHKTKEFREKRSKSFVNLILVILISIVGIGLITNLRGITSVDANPDTLLDINVVLKQFVTYNTGGFVAFDYALNHESQYNFGPLYGSGAFASIDNLFYFVNKNVNYSNNILGGFLQERTIDIGADFQWNFAYTMFYIFYKDFGIVGLVILPFIYGFFFKRVIVLYLKSNSFYLLIILSYISYGLFYSNFAYSLQSISSFLIIFSSLLFYYLSKIKL